MTMNPGSQSGSKTAGGQHSGETAEEKPLKPEEVPQPVLKTIEREALGVRLAGYALGTYQSKPIYIAHTLLKSGTHMLSRDFLVDEKGNVLELREEVDLPALPPRLRDSIIKHAGGAKVDRVVGITRDGVLAWYVVKLSREGKQSEIRVNSSGDLINPPAPSPATH